MEHMKGYIDDTAMYQNIKNLVIHLSDCFYNHYNSYGKEPKLLTTKQKLKTGRKKKQ